MFTFLKRKKRLSLEQHSEFVEIIRELAIALQSLTKDDELPDSPAAAGRNFDRASLADQKSRRIESLIAQYESEGFEVLHYRCLLHAAMVNSLITVQDINKYAANIKEDMRKLKKMDRNNYEKVKLLYHESFRVGVALEVEDGFIIPTYALPLRPEVLFDWAERKGFLGRAKGVTS